MKANVKVILTKTANHRFNDNWETFQAGVEYDFDEKIDALLKYGKTEIEREIVEKVEKPKPEPKPKPKKKIFRRKK